MARVKPTILRFASVDDVNGGLAELAELNRKVKTAELDLNAQVDALKAATAEALSPIEERKKELEGALLHYAATHPEHFTDKRSLELTHGLLGWRKSTKLVTASKTTWEQVLGNLKSFEFSEAIRTKLEVDKEVLAQWPDNKLALVGVARKEDDAFWYEPKQVELT